MTETDPLSELDPEMRAALAKSKENMAGSDAIKPGDIAEIRAGYLQERTYWNAERPELPKVENLSIDGPHGPIDVRLYYPASTPGLPVFVFCHGGGWVLGNLDSHDRMCRLLAQRSGAVVCAYDYRRAPEHTFPTPIDESVAVIDWLHASGPDLGLDPGNMAMGGDSAGAHITLGTALTLRDADRSDLRKLILIYGVFDDDGSTASRQAYGGEEFGLSLKTMAFFENCYGTEPKQTADSRRYPGSRAILSGLPPMFLAVAGCDPLRDDSVNLAERFRGAGGEAELKIYPGVLHGFFHLTRMVSLANDGIDDCAAALRASFG